MDFDWQTLGLTRPSDRPLAGALRLAQINAYYANLVIAVPGQALIWLFVLGITYARGMALNTIGAFGALILGGLALQIADLRFHRTRTASSEVSVGEILRIWRTVVFVAGVYGLALAVFYEPADVEVVLITTLLGAGLVSAALSGMHFIPIAAVTYLVLILVPLVAAMVLKGGVVGQTLSGMIAVYGLVMLGFIRQGFLTFIRTVRLSARNRALLEESEAANRAKTAFLATMSHEIRTPISGVLGMLDLILDAELSADLRNKATLARHSASGLLSIVNDALDFARLEQKSLALHAEAFELRPMLKGIVDVMKVAAFQKALTLDVLIDEDVPDRVLSDPGRIRQVVLNLVSNAIKFTEAGSVKVKVERRGHVEADRVWLRISVSDTGIGISTDVQGRLFQKFVQADQSISRRFGGAGLGLAISKELVDLLGGDISVSSTLGEGSTFVATIPVHMASALPAVRMFEQEAPQSCQILVAEDNEVNQIYLQAVLTRAGHAVTLVTDGASAVAIAKHRPFDFVLMDIQMPILDGIEAAKAIRLDDSANRNTPIIAVTANIDPALEDEVRRAGINALILKPIDLSELNSALSALRKD